MESLALQTFTCNRQLIVKNVFHFYSFKSNEFLKESLAQKLKLMLDIVSLNTAQCIFECVVVQEIFFS